MDQKKIGKVILTLRKEKNLTQQELGDLLGVSPKTISKWECGNGLPDITILNKISKELGITIDELLNGKIENEKNKSNNKLIHIIIITISLIILISIIISLSINTKNNSNEKSNSEIEQNKCTVIRTYDIKNIGQSNDGNYVYITITEFQVEGVFTIKIPKSIANDLEENKSYVFTFETDKDYDYTEELFKNSKIINIKYTDKTGMERESISNCN